jgi:hypothetical protein
VRNPGGYLQITEDGRVREHDSMTCGHCNRVTIIKARQKPEDIGGLCKICMGLICSACVGEPCVTLERRLEAAEASYHARRSYGI